MRRILALGCVLAGLALPASASAAVTPNRDATAVGTAMSTIAGTAEWLQIAPLGNPAAVADSPLSDFPRNGGTFAILSSGDAVKADPAATPIGEDNGSTESTDGPRAGVNDLTILQLSTTVPEGVNCALFSFRFLTDEEPGSEAFNDGFIAELDASNWSIQTDPKTGISTIDAPNNIAFDADGNAISVNSPGSASLTETGATGTGLTYGTSRLTAATPIEPGPHSLYLSIFDYGDEIVDSAVFLDDLRFEQRPAAECTRGAADEVAPVLSVTSPGAGAVTADTTPTFSGLAGTQPGDRPSVTVNLYAGSGAAGVPLQTLTAGVVDGEWSATPATLAEGAYTVRATQTDAGGNVGLSDPVTFTVDVPPPPPPPPPPPDPPDAPDSPDEPDPGLAPVLGQTVVAGKVSGTIRIRLRNGRFRTLGANEAIPLGSTVDATKGRVRLTSAAGPGGAVQTADFYRGQFVVTQTKGSKPITQLALSGALACGKGTASASQRRKKVRRLWGDGKGRFRTKGRHGAATVRGTRWLTEDRCDSTKITVRRGSVLVRDLVKRKNKVVKAGRSYVARKKTRK
jgi:hypothetical protein